MKKSAMKSWMVRSAGLALLPAAVVLAVVWLVLPSALDVDDLTEQYRDSGRRDRSLGERYMEEVEDTTRNLMIVAATVPWSCVLLWWLSMCRPHKVTLVGSARNLRDSWTVFLVVGLLVTVLFAVAFALWLSGLSAMVELRLILGVVACVFVVVYWLVSVFTHAIYLPAVPVGSVLLSRGWR